MSIRQIFNECIFGTLSPLARFIACFTMTRVSKSSSNILASKLLRTDGLAYITPFAATEPFFAKNKKNLGFRLLTMNMFAEPL